MKIDSKGVFRNAVEFEQAAFGEALKALDAVDMAGAGGELVFGKANAGMFVIAEIGQAVVAAPAIGV